MVANNQLLGDADNPGSEGGISFKTADIFLGPKKSFLDDVFAIPLFKPKRDVVKYRLITLRVKCGESHRASKLGMANQICLRHSLVVQGFTFFHLCPILIRMQKWARGGLKKLSFSKIFISIYIMVRYYLLIFFLFLLPYRGHSIIYLKEDIL
jgi:hypothetical protein